MHSGFKFFCFGAKSDQFRNLTLILQHILRHFDIAASAAEGATNV